jgi:hypothetical protein
LEISMSETNPPGDPFEFLKKMWGPMGQSLPGMVTPTLDVNEIDKRIGELKSVETWLGMNLNMLKMTIQGLEMQRATLAAFQSMGAAAQSTNAPAEPGATPPASIPPWPWNLMPQAAPAKPAETGAPKEGEPDAKQ